MSVLFKDFNFFLSKVKFKLFHERSSVKHLRHLLFLLDNAGWIISKIL